MLGLSLIENSIIVLVLVVIVAKFLPKKKPGTRSKVETPEDYEAIRAMAARSNPNAASNSSQLQSQHRAPLTHAAGRKPLDEEVIEAQDSSQQQTIEGATMQSKGPCIEEDSKLNISISSNEISNHYGYGNTDSSDSGDD